MITIGRKKEAHTLVEIMLECHGRIREHLALARRLADATGAPASDVQGAAQRVARYFSEALPLHVRDEDESFTPRMRGQAPAVDQALATMHEQHVAHEALVARLLAVCAELGDTPERFAALAPSLRDIATRLSDEMGAHLDLEERVVFPAVGTHLNADTQNAIIRELRERRA